MMTKDGGTADTLFRGAKLMLFAGDALVVIRRDNRPGVAWPGMLDLPGGGREGAETPEACVLRELREELGLELPEDVLRRAHVRFSETGVFYTFAARCDAAIVDNIRFGDEGQGWALMMPEDYVTASDAIPHFQHILALYLIEKTGARFEISRPGQ